MVLALGLLLVASGAAAVATSRARSKSIRQENDVARAESLAYGTLQGGTEFARWLAGRGARVIRSKHFQSGQIYYDFGAV